MKKTITIITVILLLFSFSVCYAAEMNFADVKNTDWFYKNLQELVQKNIASGYPDGTFRPDNTLKYEEFVKMLVVATGEEPDELEEGQEWYQGYIDRATENKYITEQQKAVIGQNIDRRTMAEILYNVLTEKENIKVYTDSELQYLSDKLTDVNKTDIKTLTVNGIGVISGYPDGAFKPEGTLTRAEAVAVISRVINRELRNPVKIAVRDANGIMDANDLESFPVESTGYKELAEYNVKWGDEITYKVENVIKADVSMFPIRYNNLVITGIEFLPANKAPYYGATSIGWAGSDEADAIIIRAYPIDNNDKNDIFKTYTPSGLSVTIINKSGKMQIGPTNRFTDDEIKVNKKTLEMFPDFAIGDYPEVEINKQFTTMRVCRDGFNIKNIDKIILMDEWDSTWDILEISAKDIQIIK